MDEELQTPQEKTSKKSPKIRKLSGAYRKFKGSFVVKAFYFTVGLSVVLAIGYFIFNLNVFYIQHVNVSGYAERPLINVSSEELESQLVDYIGQRIFLVNPEEVRTKLIEQNSFVKTAYVSKKVPDILDVKIVERKPEIVVNVSPTTTSGDYLKTGYIADSDGIILVSCLDEQELCKNLPYMNVVSANLILTVGQTPYIFGFSQVLQVLKYLNEHELTVAKIFMPELSVIVVEFTDQTHAIFSAEKDISVQLTDFMLTRNGFRDEGRSYLEIDVRYDRPFVRVDKYTEWMTQ